MNDSTKSERPLPKRPQWGWMAWEATVGYIAKHHSPDAMLKIEIYPGEYIIGWAASLSWGTIIEEVRDKTSLADVLSSLWRRIEQNHDLLQTMEAAVRRPANYEDNHWLDEKTYEAFSRLVSTTDTIFQGDWMVVVMYRPIEEAKHRLNTRLLAENNSINRGGHGPTLRDACRDLYHKAIPIYKKHRQDNHS